MLLLERMSSRGHVCLSSVAVIDAAVFSVSACLVVARSAFNLQCSGPRTHVQQGNWSSNNVPMITAAASTNGTASV